MPVLIAAVVLLGATSLINLLLTYGVIRRLRQHSLLLSAPQPAEIDRTLAAGSVVGEFVATASDATLVSPSSFSEPTLVGFFSPGCLPCEELLPRFVAVADRRAAVVDAQSVQRALAVVSGGADEEAYIARLSTVVPVVGGVDAQQMGKAFGVKGYPAVCVVSAGGLITASGIRLLPELQAVPA